MEWLMIEKTGRGFMTYLNDIFIAFDNKQNEYNWLISSYECNDYPSEKIPLGKESAWISGTDLAEIVNKHGIQFIWGVLSAFSKDVKYSDVMKYPLPYADGNGELWNEEVKLQHPLAEMKIVAWDSGLAILMTEDKKILEKFKKIYPHCVDIVTYRKDFSESLDL
jgi:hypothetical protein